MACRGFRSGLQVLLVLLIPLRHAGVKIPAIEVDAGRRGHQRNDILLRHVLKVHKSYDYIRHLHAGVVNVVLDIDGVTSGP